MKMSQVSRVSLVHNLHFSGQGETKSSNSLIPHDSSPAAWLRVVVIETRRLGELCWTVTSIVSICSFQFLLFLPQA